MSVERTGFREIYNFEHHPTSESGFVIGLYRITVNKELSAGDFVRSPRLVSGGAFDSSGFKNSVTEEPPALVAGA